MRILKNPEGPAYDLEFSPDSRWLMAFRSGIALGPMPSGDLKKVPGITNAYSAALAPSSLLVLLLSELVEIDPGTGERLRVRTLVDTTAARCLAVSATAGVVVAVSNHPHLLLRWSWPGLEILPPMRPGELASHGYPELRISPDGRWLAMRHGNQLVELCDLATGTQKWKATPPGLAGWSSLAFSPDSHRLAVGSGRHLTLLDVADGRALASASLEKKYYRGLAFTPDGRFLAAVSHEETVKAYDAATLALRHELAWEIGKLEQVAFSPDGMLGAATGGKKAILGTWIGEPGVGPDEGPAFAHPLAFQESGKEGSAIRPRMAMVSVARVAQGGEAEQGAHLGQVG
ncbi:MAG: hypothetical protein K2W96_12085 [Gemmataceae bacterium]|nr:hypothetical protein [Gemmataceae bacterium]